MKKNIILLLILVLMAPFTISGQISPGDLSNPHAEFEGMSKCTLCHDLGKKVSNTKCLDCHTEIQSLIKKNRGYHANIEVKAKDCFDCHSDHHGRKFEMVRFDEEAFDHELTYYSLEGKHREIDCRKCHIPDYIEDEEIKKRIDTYLGLEQECLTCHNDFHRGSLSNDCIKCHDYDFFRPAPYFDHNKTDYPLAGKHQAIDCSKCHEETIKDGKPYQVFTDIPFSDCIDCHEDSHNNQLPGNCYTCHTVEGFDKFIADNSFNHNTTKFTLIGRHNNTECFECHKKTSNPLSIFQDLNGINEQDCIACHDDKHEGKYGDNCAKCHNENSFLSLNDMSFFEHNITNYPLEGKHSEVDCKKCHTNNYSDPIDHSACKNCHDDYHQGEFITATNNPDCVDCHTIYDDFSTSTYSMDQHQTSQFPLEGAHIATPCFACHVSEEKWNFRNIGSKCIDCHNDIHDTFISNKYYPDKTCQSCHTNDAWNTINFDHNLTDWPLEGKHLTIDCRKCHFENPLNNKPRQQSFINLENNCINCHENVHNDQFEIDGITKCINCHDANSWNPSKFDHNNTKFPLDGRHVTVSCEACHPSFEKNGKIFKKYKLEKFECIDCHR